MNIIDQGIFTLEITDDTACMNFNPSNPKYTPKLIQSSFDREVKFLSKISKYKWAPEQIQVSNLDRKIFFKWYNNTCDEQLPSNWQMQLENIVRDLHTEKLYKPNFYPKCFYSDTDNCLHAFIFYSTSSYDEQPIEIDFYKPILNADRLELITKLSTDGKLDMGVLIKYAFNDYITWPENILPEIYKRVYG
jgi:hypothetical protein